MTHTFTKLQTLLLFCCFSFSLAATPTASFSTTSIGDFVWSDFNQNGIQESYEKGIKNVFIGLVEAGEDRLFNTEDDEVLSFTVTDERGFYSFDGVAEGEYVLKVYDFSFPDGYMVTYQNSGDSEEADSDFDQTTLTSDVIVVGENNRSAALPIDLGLFQACGSSWISATIGFDQVVAKGQVPDPIELISGSVGGLVGIEYLWMCRTQFTDWEAIPGANSPVYQPGATFLDTYYVLCHRRVGCPFYKESNVILIKVGDCIATIESESTEGCTGVPLALNADHDDDHLTYTWRADGPASPSSGSGQFFTVSWNTPGTYTVFLTAKGECTYTSKRTFRITDCDDDNFGCCIEGQINIVMCFLEGQCNVTVPCTQHLALAESNLYSCGPCGNATCFDAPNDDELDAMIADLNGGDVAVNFEQSVSIVPNPVRDLATLSFNIEQSATMPVRVYNSQATLVKQLNVAGTKGANTVSIDLADLDAGMYFISLEENGQLVTKKIIKTN